jgi:hypothetical protein
MVDVSVGGQTVSVHYFHCTDGISFFAGEEGSRVARDEDVFSPP